MTLQQTILIAGASGRVGRHAVRCFSDAGWDIRILDRHNDTIMNAAQGVDVILMAMNPATYATWARELLPMHADVIAAAERHGATVIVPNNVYSFGPDAGPVWGPETPRTATNPLGQLRIEIDRMYRAAGCQTIMLYSGDYIDDRASGNWFETYITPKVHRGTITYPGDLDASHAWIWLADLARVALALAEKRAELAHFEPVTVPGFTLSAHQLADALGRALGHTVTARRLSWLPMWLGRPFMPMLKGVFEMRYLWSLPHELDGARLSQLLPEFRPTPITQALGQAVAHQGSARSTHTSR